MNRFFIIGNPRSGTTLLRLMLNMHSDIAVPPEAGFLVWLHKEYVDNIDIKRFISDLKNTKKIENWHLDYNKLETYIYALKPYSYSNLIDMVYQYYVEQCLCKKVKLYGDKNNYYLKHIELLHNLYPNAKFVHIIRDGRSVAASYIDVMGMNIKTKNSPKLPIDISEIATEWVSNIQTIELSLSKINKACRITVRYEDIVKKPQHELKHIMHFMGLDYQEQMLEYYKTTEKQGLEPKEYFLWKANNSKPLISNLVEKYKSLSSKDLKTFELFAYNTLKKYHYI